MLADLQLSYEQMIQLTHHGWSHEFFPQSALSLILAKLRQRDRAIHTKLDQFRVYNIAVTNTRFDNPPLEKPGSFAGCFSQLIFNATS